MQCLLLYNDLAMNHVHRPVDDIDVIKKPSQNICEGFSNYRYSFLIQ